MCICDLEERETIDSLNLHRQRINCIPGLGLEIKLKLMKSFEIKDLGKAKYCLRIEIQRDSEDIVICQKEYPRLIEKI